MVLSTVMGIGTTVTGTTGVQDVVGRITVPAGVSQLRVQLNGFAPTDLATKGTVWFDDLWMW